MFLLLLLLLLLFYFLYSMECWGGNVSTEHQSFHFISIRFITFGCNIASKCNVAPPPLYPLNALYATMANRKIAQKCSR